MLLLASTPQTLCWFAVWVMAGLVFIVVKDENPVRVNRESARLRRHSPSSCVFMRYYLLPGTESLTILVRANRARALGSTIR